jgi:putative oxidoreductase
MKFLPLACRILLGLLFVVFGANGLHPFLHMGAPPPAGTGIGDWTNIMLATHWMQVVAFLQLLGGVLVLIGGTLPLGLMLLCPITFNILCYHMFLAGGQKIGMGIFTALLEVLLIYYYRGSFAGILTAKAQPTVTARS